jgi:transcriptional repressor NrdR
MKVALRKRPIDEERVEKVVSSIVRQLESVGENEITTKQIGQFVMDALLTLDHVAYVRYASVYRDFREPGDFNEFIDTLRQDAKAS